MSNSLIARMFCFGRGSSTAAKNLLHGRFGISPRHGHKVTPRHRRRLVGWEGLETRALLSADVSLRGALLAPPVENTAQEPAAYVGSSTTDSDKLGQVKVQFHWDRNGQQQQNSSCWIRVSQPYTGAGFGGVDIPRIVDEVIVVTDAGANLPLIIGRIYNAAAATPAALDEAFAEKGGTEDINIGVGELQECTISKTMDWSTTRLAQHAINGNSPGPAEIHFVEVAGGGQDGLCYLVYKLDRCFVKSWSTSGDADDRPTEEVAFYYNKIAFQYISTSDGHTYFVKSWSTGGDADDRPTEDFAFYFNKIAYSIGVGELQECTISKSMDSTTTLLAQHAINGNSPGPAEIHFVEVAGGGQDSGSYMQYKLDRCFVKSWSTNGDADDRPTEEVAFYYNKIAFNYLSTTDGRAM
jgi:type VI protein secretion system component Hcp